MSCYYVPRTICRGRGVDATKPTEMAASGRPADWLVTTQAAVGAKAGEMTFYSNTRRESRFKGGRVEPIGLGLGLRGNHPVCRPARRMGSHLSGLGRVDAAAAT